jgi:hypothetical protein
MLSVLAVFVLKMQFDFPFIHTFPTPCGHGGTPRLEGFHLPWLAFKTRKVPSAGSLAAD